MTKNKPFSKLFIVLLSVILVFSVIFFVYAIGFTTYQDHTVVVPVYEPVSETVLEPALGVFFRETITETTTETITETITETTTEKTEEAVEVVSVVEDTVYEEVINSPVYVLEQFFAAFPHMAVYYHNIERDFTFTHNGERVYFAASLTKAPFALYIYKKAEEGLTDLSLAHPFLEEYYAGGSGIIQYNFEFGHFFSQHQLLAYNLFYSDNIALRMLRSIHGVEGFARFIESLGGDPSLVHNITYSRITANQAGLLMLAKNDYINSDGRYSRVFLDHLLNNHYPFIESSYPVASKTGWFHQFGGAWHEMAIVYAPSPFVLVILSDNYGGGDTPYFQEIAAFLENFNRNYMETR